MQIAKEHVKRNIKHAAAQLFREKGFDKVPMREIAGRSQVGLSNIYNYYTGKDAIFADIVAPFLTDFYRMFNEHHGPVARDITQMFGQDYIQALIGEYIRLIDKHRQALYLLLFRAQGSSLEHFKDNFSAHATVTVRHYFARMKQLHPHINIDVTDSTIRLHNEWLFTVMRELVAHRKSPDETRKIITEYILFCTTGWRELMET